jgi:hypothetical protein
MIKYREITKGRCIPFSEINTGDWFTFDEDDHNLCIKFIKTALKNESYINCIEIIHGMGYYLQPSDLVSPIDVELLYSRR